MDIGNYLKLYQ